MPGKALDDGIGGTVRAEVRIRGGKVVDVNLSGPRIFYASVKTALAQYQCATSGDEEVVATQDFTFKVQ
ncbi:hypothetical protein LXM60_00705 [Pandoraea sputorum]|uniref:hypothetical protein n=1 Tax=Pandoraea sputorum TaxID=93222 RepID=UPI001E2A987F|nr:hypothetical protein [Pandoraea sputorum]MCE4058728.1 hypothetical protein [Pandoraea sputorum]